MTLTIKDIKDKPHKTKKYTVSVQKNSGLSLIIEKEKCKRFEGLIRNPSDKKLKHVPLGVFGVDIKTNKDLNRLLKDWDDCKEWVRSTGNHPKEFFTKDEEKDSTEPEIPKSE